MSKSPNILFPALGVTGIVLGGAIASTYHESGKAQIELLQDRVGQVEAHATTANENAKAEAARAADLEARIAEVQAAAAERSASAVNLTSPAPEVDASLAIGRPALADEIAAWDVDVLPDGRGLPVGSGNAFDGEEIFAEKCAACHGDFAEGVDNWPVLAGGFDTLGDKDPVKTVGSYWPHLSTVWDYVNRSMPFGEAGTLTPDETYAIVAYILYSNDLVDDEFELTQDNLGTFEMPNAGGFIVDDRRAQEYAKWRTEPCMQNCKEEVAITMRSVFLVETPEEGGSESTMNHASVDGLPTFSAAGPSFIPVAVTKSEEAVAAETPTEDTQKRAAPAADGNAELIAAGEKVFKKCKACHQVGEGAKNRSGPQLNALMGRTMGAIDGFKYSKAFLEAQAEGRVWDETSLAEFLTKPKDYMKGTKMSFSGLRKETDVEAVTEYLKTFGE